MQGGTLGAIGGALQRVPHYLTWCVKAKRTVSIGDAEATFSTGSLPRAALTDHLYRTERTVVAEMLETLEPDDVVWDVGANHGFYTCLLGQQVDEGEVIAFEPLGRNVDRMRVNLALSDVDASVRQVALGDREATVPFDPPTFTNTYRGVASVSVNGDGETIEVPMRTGDRLVANGEVPAPSIVKIDVEGAEKTVLDGMDRLLTSDVRAVFCEVHPELLSNFDASEAALLDRLRSDGFEVVPIQKRAGERHVKAIRG